MGMEWSLTRKDKKEGIRSKEFISWDGNTQKKVEWRFPFKSWFYRKTLATLDGTATKQIEWRISFNGLSRYEKMEKTRELTISTYKSQYQIYQKRENVFYQFRE